MIERCLWSDADALPAPTSPTVPERADVAVVGAGYTGLAAARELARRGASVAVLERQTVGWGASGRNGGFVLPGYKPDIDVIARRRGLIAARRLFEFSLEAGGHLEALIGVDRIACDYTRCGSVALAAKRRHLAGLDRTSRFLRDSLGYDTTLLGPSELGSEIGSSRYHGGLVDPGSSSLHPGRYVRGLAAAAVRAGAMLFERTDVLGVRREGKLSVVQTSSGTLRAGEVLVATNGYTGRAFPDLQRRVVPVGSHIIATVPLSAETAARLIPRGRVLSDTKNLLYYFRLSPDRRMVFGGRAAFTPTPVARSAELLTRGMVEVFPELAGVEVEFAWSGQVAFALDQMPHAGYRDGLHYALAYAGHGVAMSTWLGTRMGEALAGGDRWPEISGPLRAVPLYNGRPWFLPLVGGYYRLKDLLD